jgi:cytoskeletal protein CcmA (bactofilin family)
MHVLGNIISDGALDIDGKIDGNVRGHTISVRENGFIRGDVMAEAVYIYGKVDGLIKARHVMLYTGAEVRGTVMHESLTIEDGALIDGKIKRTNYVAPEEHAAPRLLRGPTTIENSSGGSNVGGLNNDNDNEEPQSEAEMKILESLRLIS